MNQLTGSASNELTPDQRVAREFWATMSAGSPMSLFVVSQLAAIADGDYDDDDSRMAAYQDVLKRLRYPKLEVLLAEFEPTTRAELGFWAGRYALVDAEHREYVLRVNSEGANLSGVDVDVDVEASAFVDGVLRIEGASGLELRFTSPALNNDAALSALNAPGGQARCEGTAKVAGGAPAVAIRGKRGCFSVAGIDRAEDGDPLEYWAGGYGLLFTDTFEWSDDEVAVEVADGKLVLSHGALTATDVRSGNNSCTVQLGTRQLAARFELSDERKQFYGAFHDGTKTRPVTAYLTRKPTVASAASTMFRSASHAMLLGAEVVELDPTQTSTAYVLPAGAGGVRAYSAHLSLKSGHGLVAPMTWALVNANAVSDFLELHGQLAPNSDKATLTGSILEGKYSFGAIVTDSSAPQAKSVTFPMTLTVGGKTRPVIEIDLQSTGATYQLPDAMESNQYAVDLRLTNAGESNTGKFAWAAGDPSDSVWEHVSMNPVGKVTATLVGSIRPLTGKGHNPFTIKVTGPNGIAIELKLSLDILGLRLIEVSHTELRPVTLRRPFTAELTAAGGRDPYTWDLLDPLLDDNKAVKKDSKGNPYFGVEGLIFTTDFAQGKATISGSVSDLGLSGTKVGVRIGVSSAPTLIMDQTTETLYIEVVEPEEQAKDIQGWVAFGILLFITGIPVAGFIKKWGSRAVDYARGKAPVDPNKSIVDAVGGLGTKLSTDAVARGILDAMQLQHLAQQVQIAEQRVIRTEGIREALAGERTTLIREWNRVDSRLQTETSSDKIRELKERIAELKIESKALETRELRAKDRHADAQEAHDAAVKDHKAAERSHGVI